MRHTIISSVLVTIVGLSGPALALSVSRPAGEGLILVIAAPWSDGAAAIIHASGGFVVGPRDTWVAAFATDPSGRDGFVTKLQDQGAWRVLDGAFFAQLCGVSTS